MLPRKLRSISAFAGSVAMSLCVLAPAASSDSTSPTNDQAQYLPIQSIGYDFGSKSMSGYFVERDATCLVTLMIVDKSDPDRAPPQSSATRVRLVLNPGQIAGLDSEEGRSLNFTCGEAARTLLVDLGERDRLVAQQARALANVAANSH